MDRTHEERVPDRTLAGSDEQGYWPPRHHQGPGLHRAGRVVAAVGAVTTIIAGSLAMATLRPGSADRADGGAGRVDMGRATCKTDGEGFCTVAHNLGETPAAVQVTLAAPVTGFHASPVRLSSDEDSYSATTFRLRAMTDVGPYTGQLTVSYVAYPPGVPVTSRSAIIAGPVPTVSMSQIPNVTTSSARTEVSGPSTPAASPAQAAPPTPPALPTTPSSAPTDPRLRLVFEDQFNGSSVDTTRWSMYTSPGHNGNGVRRPSAFTVSNGLLTVTAEMVNGTLVSGGMAHRSNYAYGRFEFRVRTEVDPSAATSGVLLTWPQSERWPMDGENDMYETGTAPNRSAFHTFIHYGTTPSTQYHFQHGVRADQWHVVAMEWEANRIRLYRDGSPVWSLTDTKAIPDVYHHLCIQLDAFKKTMGGPVRMYVDYVRIYRYV